MVDESPNPFQAGGHLTIARRNGDPEQIAAAEAVVAEAKIAAAIKRNLASAALSNDQLARLRDLLRGAQR